MNKESSGGFIQNLLASLFGGNDADAEKKRQLKFIAKRLSKSRFNKFYHYPGNEALPPLAKFFYEIYKALAPAQIMFQNIQASQNKNLLNRLVFDFAGPAQGKSLEESRRA
ncbi:MAG: hypothetical protein K2H09_01235 [Treponemataceae bacterium]|nr:hypothetical protein [Treponemataceae bacterium]